MIGVQHRGKRGWWRPAALAAGALVVALSCVASASAQNRPFYGVVQQGALSSTLGSTDFTRMQGGRVGTLRFLVDWKNYETAVDYDWRQLDRVIGAAAANGVRSLPFIFQHPAPRNHSERRAMADFARAMARRYGPGGDFWLNRQALPIVSWQILNEQNGRSHWGRKPQPRSYALTLRATARAIRNGLQGPNARAEIVLGGMFGTPSGAGSMRAWRYLDRLYRVNIPVKRFFDTVAAHPYAPEFARVREQMKRIRKVMRRHNHRSAGIRVTEIGWGSDPPRVCSSCKGPGGQADLLERSFRVLSNHRNRRGGWNVGGINWFSWQDGSGCPFCPSSGLFRGPVDDRQPKPSWRAFRKSTR